MTNIIACCLYYLAFQFVKEHVIKTLTFALRLMLGKNTSYYALI